MTSRLSSRERVRCGRFGFSLLGLTALSGLGLELAHALKLAPYLDDELTRLLLTLAHAHGGLGALIVLAFGSQGAPLFAPARANTVGRSLRTGVALLSLGFGLGWIEHPEGDPNVWILLAPIGGGLVAVSLIWTALASFGFARGTDAADGEDPVEG